MHNELTYTVTLSLSDMVLPIVRNYIIMIQWHEKTSLHTAIISVMIIYLLYTQHLPEFLTVLFLISIFANSIFILRQVLNINVGLGSDIPAGHSPSIFEACLHAITASKALNDGGNSQLSSEVWGYSWASVSFREAFWLATGGDGKILDLPTGKLRKDYFVDTMVINTNGHNLDIIIYDDTTEDIL